MPSFAGSGRFDRPRPLIGKGEPGGVVAGGAGWATIAPVDAGWVVLIAVGALAAFVCFWLAITFLISLFGWRGLASAYAATAPFAGPVSRWNTGRIGLARYGTSLTVGADPVGLFLAVLPLFRIGHRPLFIPWDEVTHVGRTHDLFGFSILVLGFRRSGVTVKLLGRDIEDYVRACSAGGLRDPS